MKWLEMLYGVLVSETTCDPKWQRKAEARAGGRAGGRAGPIHPSMHPSIHPSCIHRRTWDQGSARPSACARPAGDAGAAVPDVDASMALREHLGF